MTPEDLQARLARWLKGDPRAIVLRKCPPR